MLNTANLMTLNVKPLINSLAHLTNAIWIYGISIEQCSDRNWQNLEIILKENFPALREQIEKITFSRDHQFRAELRQELSDLQEDSQIDLRIHV